MNKKNILIGLAAILVIATIAFFIFRTEPIKPISDKVVIGYPTLRIALPVFVAQEKGYFKEQGLNVELQKFETAQPMMDALVSGSISIAGYTALPITFSAMARSKTNLLFLSGIYEDDSHPISILIVKNDSSIKKIQDLKGKRVGILPTRAYEVWLQKILAANQVDPNDVIIQHIAPNMQVDALGSGTVDALFTNDPAATITIAKGVGVPFTTEALVPKATNMTPFYFGSFNISERYAKENPEIVKRIAIALDQAIDYINSNPDSAQLAMMKFLPEPQQKFVSKFPKSYFKKVNEVSNEDLLKLKSYYLIEKVIPIDFNINNLQYNY